MAWYDGLVGPTPGATDQERKSLANSGLLNAGLSILSANSQPGVTPIQAISGGLLGGIQSAQQGARQLSDDKFQQQRQQFQQSQMQAQQQEQQRRQQIQDLALKFAKPDGTFDMPGYQAALSQIDPQAAMELHQNELKGKLADLQIQKAQRPETQEVNSGDSILTQEVGLDGTRKTIATAPRWNPKQMGLGGGVGGGGGKLGPGAFQLIQGQDGQYYNVNKVTGEVTPVQAGGEGVIGTNSFRQQTQQTKNIGEQAAAQGGVASFDTALSTLQSLKNDPGLEKAVGFGGETMSKIPGTDAANFKANLDAFKSQTFLPAVQQLKGMGALSDAEGSKLASAFGALSQQMSTDRFRSQIDDVSSQLKAARDRAASKAAKINRATGAGATQAQQGASQGMSAEDAFAKYGVK